MTFCLSGWLSGRIKVQAPDPTRAVDLALSLFARLVLICNQHHDFEKPTIQAYFLFGGDTSGSSHYVHRRYMFGGEMADTRANESRGLALGSREKAKKYVLNQAAWHKD